MSWLAIIVPLALEIGKFILNRMNVSNEVKLKFFEFAKTIAGESLNSVRLRDSYSRQLEELKKNMEKENGNNT